MSDLITSDFRSSGAAAGLSTDFIKPLLPFINTIVLLGVVWVFRSRAIAIEEEMKLLKETQVDMQKTLHDFQRRLSICESQPAPQPRPTRHFRRPVAVPLPIEEDDDWDDMDVRESQPSPPAPVFLTSASPVPEESVTDIPRLDDELDLLLKEELDEIQHERTTQ